MRSWLFAAGTAAALVTVFACSSTTTGQSSSGGTSGTTPDGSPAPGQPDDPPDPDGSLPPAPDPPPEPKVNVTNETFESGGVAYGYVQALPKTYDAAKSYPLVFVFHGDGGDGAGMRAYHPLDDVTGADAIVVYPSGKNATWDVYTPFDQNPGQQFVQALADALKAKYSVDANRVFAVGWSRGGFLASQLACRRAGLFTGVVIHAGGAPNEPGQPPPKNDVPDCAGAPAAVFVTHGENDGEVLVSSGRYAGQFWATKSGCNAQSLTDTAPAPCKQYDGCPAGKRVTYCEIAGQGHGVWPAAIAAEWSFLKGS